MSLQDGDQPLNYTMQKKKNNKKNVKIQMKNLKRTLPFLKH